MTRVLEPGITPRVMTLAETPTRRVGFYLILLIIQWNYLVAVDICGSTDESDVDVVVMTF